MIDATSINIISIHAPREGGDNFQIMAFNMFHVFQSTPPARGATRGHVSCPRWTRFQSTPPARGATFLRLPGKPCPRISIHAPREGGDAKQHSCIASFGFISIHAPREGGDAGALGTPMTIRMISIHAPREGGDLVQLLDVVVDAAISIHAPREGGDGAEHDLCPLPHISIHAPREGGDCGETPSSGSCRYFNPRPPRGGRRRASGRRCPAPGFQSTPPARGATAEVRGAP